jgi:hypothetical protein
VSDPEEKLETQIKEVWFIFESCFSVFKNLNKPKNLVLIHWVKNGYQISTLKNIKVLARKSSNRNVIVYSWECN